MNYSFKNISIKEFRLGLKNGNSSVENSKVMENPIDKSRSNCHGLEIIWKTI